MNAIELKCCEDAMKLINRFIAVTRLANFNQSIKHSGPWEECCKVFAMLKAYIKLLEDVTVRAVPCVYIDANIWYWLEYWENDA